MKYVIKTCCYYETKKFLIAKKGWIFLLVSLLIQIILCFWANPNRYRYTFDMSLYKQYTDIYSGAYNKKTAQTINANLIVLEKLSTERPTLENETVFDYAEKLNNITISNQKHAALSAIQKKYSSMEYVRTAQPKLIYDLELIEYIQTYSLCWIALFGTILIAPIIMLSDEKCGMQQILFPTAVGSKNIVTAKLLTSCVISIAITAICIFVQCFIFSKRWDFGDMSAPIQSVSGFEECTVPININTAMLFAVLIQILSAPMIILLCCTISLLLRKDAAAVATSAVIIAISALFANKFPDYSPLFLFTSISGIKLFQKVGTIDLFFLLFFVLIRILLLGALSLYLGTKKK